MKYKNVTGILLSGVLAIGLTGCFEEEMKCNNEVTQSLVKDLSQVNIASAIFLKRYTTGEYGEPNYLMNIILSQSKNDIKTGLINMSALYRGKNELSNSMDTMLKNYITVEEELKNSTSSMDGFITTKQNKELAQVECSATLHYTVNKINYDFSTTYLSQLTDDREQVSVELYSLDMQ